MSRARTWLIKSSSAGSGSAPAWLNTMTPSRRTISVGIDMMPNAPASSCWSSVSILPNTMSVWVSDAFSKMGANMRHGPHHDAQKSTSTMSLLVTVSSKVSLVRVTVAIRGWNLLGTARIPTRRLGIEDDPDRSVETDVVPRPAHQDPDPVLESHQVVEVHDEPDDPPEEPGEAQALDLTHGRTAADRGERALVAVAERAARPTVEDVLRHIATGLHRGRGHHR